MISDNESAIAQQVFEYFEAVADFADKNSIDYSIFKDEGEWCGILKLRDAKGPFQADMVFMRRGWEIVKDRAHKKRIPHEDPIDFKNRIGKSISTSIMNARKARMHTAIAFGKAA